MFLKCYFDGGNKSDSAVYDHVTLAAVCGTSDQCARFEKAWNQVLRKHGALYLHTTDLLTGNGPFTRKNGWTKPKAEAFLSDCVRVVGRHIARPITETEPDGRLGIYPYSVTIDLKDYIRARSDMPEVPPNLDEVLATDTINAVFMYAQQFERAHGYKVKFSLIYDQNEPYRGFIIDRQRKAKALKTFPMFGQIVSNTEADMRSIPELQFADLLAWCSLRERNDEKPDWHRKMLAHPQNRAYGDYDKLIKPIPKARELNAGLKLPKRKATR